MKLRLRKITLILVIFAALTMPLSYPAIAADNSYSVRISCIIPAIPGQNMPILQEPVIIGTEKRVNSPAIFQKDTQEMRVIAGEKMLTDVETLYSR